MKLGRLMLADKAKETGSKKEIASDNGNKLNAIGHGNSRKCLDCIMSDVMDQCREVGIPNRCDHGNY